MTEQEKFFAKVAEVNGPIEVNEHPLDEPGRSPTCTTRSFAHADEMSAALKDADKLARMAKVADLKAAIKAEFTDDEQVQFDRAIPVELKSLEKHAMREMVVETGERVDGRAADEDPPHHGEARLPAPGSWLRASSSAARPRCSRC